jgi:cyanophycinase
MIDGQFPDRSVIVLIPWASERTDEELLHDFCIWMSFDSDQPPIIMAPAKVEMSRPDALDRMKQLSDTASAFFFCGGDQVFIADVIYSVPGLKDLFEAAYNAGVPFAGTSAGCAVMSQTMITGEGNFDVIDHSQVETKRGLGFVVNAVLDQHFVARRRMNRLLSVLAGCSEVYGIGIDEEMAVAIVDDYECEVLGSASCVLLIEKPGDSLSSGVLTMKVLRSGDRFNIVRTPK